MGTKVVDYVVVDVQQLNCGRSKALHVVDHLVAYL